MESGIPNQERIPLATSFEHVNPDYLCLLIADMLVRLMGHNDRIPLVPEILTRFHSRTSPNISVLDYLRRIVQYTKVEVIRLFCASRQLVINVGARIRGHAF